MSITQEVRINRASEAKMPLGPQRDDQQLPGEVVTALEGHAIAARDEVELRRVLELYLPGYTLYRLTPAAARRWKARYRIMFGADYIDCQTVAEAYARALLAVLDVTNPS